MGAETVIESCGLYGKSSIQIFNLKTSKVFKKTEIDGSFFAEGCDTYYNSKEKDLEIYQLTWRERKVF